MRLPRKFQSRGARRRGLAPVELVLSLPLLLFVMALMMNFGAAASWKVRAATAARQAMWRSRSLWNGAQDPNPENWQPPATMSASSTTPLRTTSSYWDQPQINQPFARGPMITVPGGSGQDSNPYIQVRDPRLYDMAGNVYQGTSHIRRQFPLLPALGPYTFDVTHPLVDSRWQFQSMGYGDNLSRRAKGWYNFETSPGWASQAARFQAADQVIVSNPHLEDLIPLDRDDEFLAFTGSAPDFYPKIGGCGIKVNQVRQNQIVSVGGLIDRIRGRKGIPAVPGIAKTMTLRFLDLYQSQLRRMQQQGGGGGAGGDPTDLQTKIKQLENFLGQL